MVDISGFLSGPQAIGSPPLHRVLYTPDSQQNVLVPTFSPNSPIYFTPFTAGNDNHYYWIWYADPHSHVYTIYVATHVVLDPHMTWDVPYLGPPPHHGDTVVQQFGLGPANTQNLIEGMVPVSPAGFTALAAAADQISVDRWRLDPQLPNLRVYGSLFGDLKGGTVGYDIDGPGLGESVFERPFTPGDWDGLTNSCARVGNHVLYNQLVSPTTTEVTILVDGKRFGTEHAAPRSSRAADTARLCLGTGDRAQHHHHRKPRPHPKRRPALRRRLTAGSGVRA